MIINQLGMAVAHKVVKGYTTDELVKQIKMYEKIIGFDEVMEFMFLDEIMAVYDLMRDECVRRLANVISASE